MKLKPLTERQAEVLDFIKAYIARTNYSPTIMEIVEHFSIKVSEANDIVFALEKKGAIRRIIGKPRTITVIYGEES
jgi:repressor LexA